MIFDLIVTFSLAPVVSVFVSGEKNKEENVMSSKTALALLSY